MQSFTDGEWWTQKWLLVLIVAVAATPFMWPTIPPLIDLPAHMGRYAVELNISFSEYLQRYFTYGWQLVANLGVDLLVVPLAPLFGLEMAVKLIMLAIAAMTAAGFLWVAREIHGRMPPFAFFALPLVFGYPMLFGFANYCLSMALAFVAFGFWLSLSRRGMFRLRSALFFVIAFTIWLCHLEGWAVFVLLCFTSETFRLRGAGKSWTAAIVQAAIFCAPVATPILLTILWRWGMVAKVDWSFEWLEKAKWIVTLQRDRWLIADVASGILIYAVVGSALVFRRQLRINPALGFAALFLLLMYLIMPMRMMGSGFPGVRLIPFIVALAVLAIDIDGSVSLARRSLVAAAGLSFFLFRMGLATVSMVLYDSSYAANLAALVHIPRGSAVATFVGRPCSPEWYNPRLDHLGSMAIVRKEAFVNDQFAIDGAQLIGIRYSAAYPFTDWRGEIVSSKPCPGGALRTVKETLDRVPRQAFDFVWLVNLPSDAWPAEPWLEQVWRGPNTVLYRVLRNAG